MNSRSGPLNDPDDKPLFTSHSVREVFESRLRESREALDWNQRVNSLGVSWPRSIPADLASTTIARYRLQTPRLLHGDITQAPPREEPPPRRTAGSTVNNGLAAQHPMIRHSIFVPFEGDDCLFRCTPTKYIEVGIRLDNIPSARIAGQQLILTARYSAASASTIHDTFTQQLETIQKFLDALKQDVDSFNTQLEAETHSHLAARHKNLESARHVTQALGFPLKKIEPVTQAFTLPSARRNLDTTALPATPNSSKPEPFLRDEDYLLILDRLSAMAIVLERSPRAFAEMSEEHLRFLFLIPLNCQFDSVSAETFNFSGKTDILIRDRESNIFIAECKIWKGPEGLKEAIDQLLGYITWRDTKTAILLFARNKHFSKVLAQVPDTVKQHKGFKKELVDCPRNLST
jgi:hypothetical protein